MNLGEGRFATQGVAGKGVKDHLLAPGRHGADVTKDFEGSSVAGRLEAVHAPNVVRGTPLKAVDEAVPNLAFVAPVVVVSSLAGSAACGLIGSGLREFAGSTGDGDRAELAEHDSSSGIEHHAGHFDEVTGDHGDSGLNVVKEFVGQAPAVVLGFWLVEAESEVGRLGVALKFFARHPTHKAHIRPALGLHIAFKVGNGVAAADHYEFYLRAQGRGFDEFLGSSVDVDSGALENNNRLIFRQSQFHFGF